MTGANKAFLAESREYLVVPTELTLDEISELANYWLYMSATHL